MTAKDTPNERRGAFLRKGTLLRIWERLGHIESDGEAEQLESLVYADLVDAFGPVSEGRYLRPPFDVSAMKSRADGYAYSELPTLFEAEHFASLSRLQLVRFSRSATAARLKEHT